MSELNRSSKPARGPARCILRALLAIAGLIGVVAVPVFVWQTFAPRNIDQSVGGPASDAVGLPSFSNTSARLSPSFEKSLLEIYLRFQGEDTQAPVSDDPTPVTFSVSAGETAAQISQRLEDEGLIRDANVFRALLRVHGVDTRLEAGDYQLHRNMSMAEIMATLQHGRPPTVTLTIPEGWRAEQIAALLAEKGLADPLEFLSLVRTGAGFEYDFLSDRPEGITSLEGYLFPDTYAFPPDATAADVIDRMLTTFGERFTPEMRQQVKDQGLSIHDAVTLASIIEREARVPDERTIIASVFHNRLRSGMYLNADPTVQYALGYHEDAGQWWKRPLYLEDLEVDSAYNTYIHVGLPPGPICNPGLAALQAAVAPADTDYYYFVANDVAGDGSHVFAKTLEEHNANVEKYRR